MATATVSTKTITTGVVLNLTPDEADTLRVILHNVGGPFHGRRAHAASMADALDHAGIGVRDDIQAEIAGTHQLRGAIYFP